MFVCGQIFSSQPGGSLLMRTMQHSYLLIAGGKNFSSAWQFQMSWTYSSEAQC